MSLQMRLAVYSIPITGIDVGNQVGFVDFIHDAWDINLMVPFNDTPVLTFKMKNDPTATPRSGQNAYGFLTAGLEIAVQFSKGGTGSQATWYEPPNCRFYAVEDDSDAMDPNRVVSITCVGVVNDLNGIYLSDPSQYTTDGKKRIGGTAAGGFMTSIMDTGRVTQELGMRITRDFTLSVDSTGEPWTRLLTLDIAPTVTARQLLDSLTAQNLCNWRMEGNKMRMWEPGRWMGSGRPGAGAGDVTYLVPGKEILSAPQKRSARGMAQKAMVVGDGGNVTIVNPELPKPLRGYQAVAISQQGVSDPVTLYALGAAQIAQTAIVTAELTREIATTGDSNMLLPFFGYAPGDKVWAPGLQGAPEEMVIKSITLSKAGPSNLITGSILFGERVLDEMVRLSKRMKGIVGGSTITGGTGAISIG